mmetsp:Transcript_21658/g.48233  ORF Transcript_21658/g.48233 Transcript_21658/m.48233 type:complete len:231 (-) Transcript_21658:715-1407(-)
MPSCVDTAGTGPTYQTRSRALPGSGDHLVVQGAGTRHLAHHVYRYFVHVHVLRQIHSRELVCYLYRNACNGRGLRGLLGAEALHDRHVLDQRHHAELLVLPRQPRVRQSLLHREPLLRVQREQCPDERLGLLRDTIPVLRVELVLALQNLAEYGPGVVLGLVERRVPTEQHEERYTQTPHVHGLAVRFPLHDLGCDVSGCAGSLLRCGLPRPDCESEVHNLYIDVVLPTR